MRNRIAATLVFIAFFAISACDSPKVDDTLLRVGVLKHSSTIPIIVANAKGYFQDNGLKVELLELGVLEHMPSLLRDDVSILSPSSFPSWPAPSPSPEAGPACPY